MKKTGKDQPKTFSLHWGKGIVEEEAQFEAEYHLPTIQLLKFTDGVAKDTREIRFCHYDHYGRFKRSPLIIDEGDIPKLKKALRKTPELRKILAKLID